MHLDSNPMLDMMHDLSELCLLISEYIYIYVGVCIYKWIKLKEMLLEEKCNNL